jgi:hypothetical protein
MFLGAFHFDGPVDELGAWIAMAAHRSGGRSPYDAHRAGTSGLSAAFETAGLDAVGQADLVRRGVLTRETVESASLMGAYRWTIKR